MIASAESCAQIREIHRTRQLKRSPAQGLLRRIARENCVREACVTSSINLPACSQQMLIRCKASGKVERVCTDEKVQLFAVKVA